VTRSLGRVDVRSLARIRKTDLLRLGRIAHADAMEFFQRNPSYSVFADRVIAVALCQGAALHYIDQSTGVKDFDVWTFYAAAGSIRYPWRKPRIPRDFGIPRFGTTPDYEHFIGRRVDCLGRSLRVPKQADPILAIHSYLASGRKKSSPFELAQKAVVLIEPAGLLGEVIWHDDPVFPMGAQGV
jgi:hypothetical protein